MAGDATDPAAPPPATVTVRARTSTGTNWTGAFLLYAKNMTLAEVSTELGIPLQRLKEKCRSEDWDNLIRLNKDLAPPGPRLETAPQPAGKIKAAAAAIEANRASALEVAQKLRGQVLRVLTAFEQGNLFLPVQDIATLAKATQQIDLNAMLALGDDPAPKLLPEAPAGGKPSKDERPVTHFHIHPPAQAMGRRREKTVVEEPVAELPGPGRAVDAVLTTTTGAGAPAARVELAPAGNDAAEDVSNESATGRAGVDFKKLAAEVGRIKTPRPAPGGIPAFARSA